ncbi:MAG: hypothetical protein JXR73_05775 [Candidatus Omnitrophica bacterium]|nr:hypothetical protein [Candidatus Omnitrophota bacterium]
MSIVNLMTYTVIGVRPPMNPKKKQFLHKIENLGVPALPCAIEKMKEDGVDLIEAVNYWTDDALKKSAEKAGVPQEQMREYSLQWWRRNKADWLLPPVEDHPKQ